MVQLPLGYKLKGRKGYWQAIRAGGTWRLTKREGSGFKEIPFPSEESMKDFLRENAEYHAVYDVDNDVVVEEKVRG